MVPLAPSPFPDAVPVLAASPGARAGGRGPALAALLGMPAHGRVLLMGPGLERWCRELPAHFYLCCHVPSAVDAASALVPGAWRVVVWAAGEGEDVSPRTLAAVQRALHPQGTLLLLAPNRFSLRALARHPLAAAAGEARSAAGWRRALGAAGFAGVETYLPLPSLAEAEEYAAPGEGEVALRADAPWERRAAAALGVYESLHEGYAFLASAGPDGGTRRLLRRLEEGLEDALPGVRLVPQRFDLRERGALVLLLRDGTSDTRLACRVAAGDAARAAARNAAWTRRVADDARIAAWARDRVPRPRAALPAGVGTAFVEDRIRGVVGWKVARVPRLRRAAADDLVRFALRLGEGTAHTRRMEAAELVHLGRGDAPPPADGACARLQAALRERLVEGMRGRERRTCLAHGDFGYGNAIVQGATGRLNGVVDWDGAGEDLAGVDALNFAVQARRVEAGLTLPAALEDAGDAFVRGGFAAVGAPALADWLPLDGPARAELAAWTVLRMTVRAARHPHLFAADAEPHAAALRWALGAAEAGAAGGVP
jgi:hypothetical protein